MGRFARAIAKGQPHHVTQRGNFGQDVFETDEDRIVYLDWLRECADRHGVSIRAYCLMANHVHLVAVPKREDSLGRCLAQVHMRYSSRINRRRGQRGHLWQGRFYSCVLDEGHTWAAVRYIERNPVRAGLVSRAEEYRWSSAAGHCGLRNDPLLSGELELSDHVGNWQEWLAEGEDDEQIERLRLCTNTGRPCGDQRFIRRIERRLGRRLAPLPVGRPKAKPKKKKKKTSKTARKSKSLGRPKAKRKEKKKKR